MAQQTKSSAKSRSRSNGRNSSATGRTVGAGLEFVMLAADGRIQADYQFVE